MKYYCPKCSIVLVTAGYAARHIRTKMHFPLDQIQDSEADQCNRCKGTFRIKDMSEVFTMQTYYEPSSFDGYICNNCQKHEAEYYRKQERQYEKWQNQSGKYDQA